MWPSSGFPAVRWHQYSTSSSSAPQSTHVFGSWLHSGKPVLIDSDWLRNNISGMCRSVTFSSSIDVEGVIIHGSNSKWRTISLERRDEFLAWGSRNDQIFDFLISISKHHEAALHLVNLMLAASTGAQAEFEIDIYRTDSSAVSLLQSVK